MVVLSFFLRYLYQIRATITWFEYDFGRLNFKNKRAAILNLSLTGLSSAVAFGPTAASTGLQNKHQPDSGLTGVVTA